MGYICPPQPEKSPLRRFILAPISSLIMFILLQRGLFCVGSVAVVIFFITVSISIVYAGVVFPGI